MVASVMPGVTTDEAFETRWGKPVQIIREGAQQAWIYRDMTNPPGPYFLQFGDSSKYVIVDFQYGVAVGARSSEMVGCRGTFAPRPTGYEFDNPSTVHPVNCGQAPAYGTGPITPQQDPYPYLK